MMKPKQFIVSVVNLAIFAIAGIALYELGNRNAWTGAGTQTTQQNIQTEVPVSVGTIETATLSRTLTAYGHIEPAPASTTQPAAEARVTVASASLVSEVDCIEGQHVEKGQLLFRLDHRAANAAVARAMQFLSASQAISDSLSPSSRPSDIPAWMTLVARWQVNLAQAQLQQAEAENFLLDVTSPISGTVAALNVRPGEVANPAIPAVEVVDTDRLVAALDVPGLEIGNVKIGQVAKIELTGGGSISAEVTFVDPTIDPATGLDSVDVAVPQGSAVKIGQFVHAEIVLEQQPDCLAVPAGAIVLDSLGRAQIAIVSDDQRTASMQFVDIGLRQADLVQVSAQGLQAGETIVTGGAYGLLSRTGIRVVGQ
jgi:membrane fusion protein, multidrug efflux system